MRELLPHITRIQLVLKLTLVLVIFTALTARLAPLVQAVSETFTITCKNKGECEHSHPGAAFFTAQNIVPGTVLERPVTIRNQQAKEGCTITIRGKPTEPLNTDLESALEIRIIASTGLSRSYPLTTVLETTAPVAVDTLNAKTTRDYTWQLAFASTAGNQYQGSQTSFDFDLIFTCDATIREPTPTPTPLSSPTPTPTPSCTTPAPTSSPVLTVEEEENPTKVTLRWQKVPNATSYQLSFTTIDQSLRYENTDVGNTNQFTVTGLQPQYEYSFYLKAVRGCAVGPASLPVLLRRSNPILPQPDKLLENIPSVASPGAILSTGSVLGASIEVADADTNLEEIPPDEVLSSEGEIFFLILIGLFMLFVIVRRKKQQKLQSP